MRWRYRDLPDEFDDQVFVEGLLNKTDRVEERLQRHRDSDAREHRSHRVKVARRQPIDLASPESPRHRQGARDRDWRSAPEADSRH